MEAVNSQLPVRRTASNIGSGPHLDECGSPARAPADSDRIKDHAGQSTRW